MLLSMTGHGDARRASDGLTVTVDIRTINSRYFKLVLRGTEAWSGLESRVEAVVRKTVRRGTANVLLRVERESRPEDYRVQKSVLLGYREQLNSLSHQCNGTDQVPLGDLLGLPGVIEDATFQDYDSDATWKVIEPTLHEALENLESMRRVEGRAMAADVESNCKSIAGNLDQIELRAPNVITTYEKRLVERITKLLAEYQVTAAPVDVIREVGIFSERCDISEEVVRLRSHLDQFADIMGKADSAGRKLDFLVQEMFREANTIGSKANDATIARHVVEVKTCIERMREMVQNVE